MFYLHKGNYFLKIEDNLYYLPWGNVDEYEYFIENISDKYMMLVNSIGIKEQDRDNWIKQFNIYMKQRKFKNTLKELLD